MPLTPAYLSVVRGRQGYWPLTAARPDGTAAVGVFAGTETLSASVARGADAVLPAALTAVWTDAPNAKYLLAVADTQSALLSPGAYTVTVALDPAVSDRPLLEVPLIVEAAPAGDGVPSRALATPADLAALVPESASSPAAGMALESATRAIEAFCRRPLVLANFDRCYRPGRTRRIYLDTWPVCGPPSLTYDLMTAGSVWNTNISGVQQASVSMTPVAPGMQTPASLALNWTSSGVPSSRTFTLSQYPTIQALLDAISAVGSGWQVVSPGYASTPNWQAIAQLPPSRLYFQGGYFGALNQQVNLSVYAVEVNAYVLHPQKHAYIELVENRPEAYRYGDRSFAMGFGWSWSSATIPLNANVRCVYRAGYAVTQADLALGYEPVPQDLRDACVLTAQALIAGAPLAGMVQGQTVGGRSYQLKQGASLVPAEVRPYLAAYINWDIGGWGQ